MPVGKRYFNVAVPTSFWVDWAAVVVSKWNLCALITDTANVLPLKSWLPPIDVEDVKVTKSPVSAPWDDTETIIVVCDATV